MGGQWKRSWKRDDLSRHSFLQVAASRSRARQLAEISLPPDSRYFLIPFDDGSWGWLYGKGVEERTTPPVKPRRSKGKIYTPAGANAKADRELRKMATACESGAVEDD